MGFSRQEYWSGVPLPSLRNSPTESQMMGLNGFLYIKFHEQKRSHSQAKPWGSLSPQEAAKRGP